MDDHVYKNKIIRNADLRNGRYGRICVSFSSVISSNLSGTVIWSGGSFTGNGWLDCSFYGSCCKGMVMELEQYDRCSMSGMRLERAELCRIRAAECGFVGNRWTQIHMRDCLFQNCSFRDLYLAGADLADTVFRGCVFDGVLQESVRLSGIVFRECEFSGKIKGFSEGCIFQNCFIDC